MGDYSLSIAHNGNLVNIDGIRKQLQEDGALFQTTTDTELIIHLLAREKGDSLAEKLEKVLLKIEGAYSLILLTTKEIIAARDPHGIRPFCMGKLKDTIVFASETCALDLLGAEYVREVNPGEIIVANDDGFYSRIFTEPLAPKHCIFEYIYFSRPDSVVEGIDVYQARKRIGAELAREHGVNADIVVPVPDSGVPGAIGFAEQARIPFDLGIIRNHYVGRTFIEPTDSIRHLGVRLKHNANRAVLSGRRVVLVDDSIVRGTTSTKIVELVRGAGAIEVHMRIASPPTTHSCFYGVDTPTRDQLLAFQMDVAAMAGHIGVDSLAFISTDGMYRAMGHAGRDPSSPQFCDACFTGDYPIEQ
jgi:amidophosphoribosyltransferase